MSRIALSGIALALTLAGCATPIPVLTQQEVTSAQQSGELEALYDQYAAQLAERKLNSPEGQQAQTQLNNIGDQLAQKKAQAVNAALKAKSSASGLAPIPFIDEQMNSLGNMQQWSFERYDRLIEELNGSKARSQARITELQETLGALPAKDVGQRPALLAELATLSGDNRYSTERDDVLNQLKQRIDNGLANGQYEDARSALFALKITTPNDKSLDDKLITLNARLFEKRFWETLSDGKTDEAYEQFVTLSKDAEFPALLKKLSRSGNDMVAYYTAQAGAAQADSRLNDAYKLLQQAQDIRKRSNAAPALSPQESAFLQLAHEQYQLISQTRQHGLALGYLEVIKSLNPDQAKLGEQIDMVNTTVLTQALLSARTLTASGNSKTDEEVQATAPGLYTEIARNYAAEGQQALAAENAAYALSIARKNGKETPELLQHLVRLTLSNPLLQPAIPEETEEPANP